MCLCVAVKLKLQVQVSDMTVDEKIKEKCQICDIIRNKLYL